MPETAVILSEAMSTLGEPFPRDRSERKQRLALVSEELLNQLATRFYKLMETESGGFQTAANAFADSIRKQ